MASQPSSHAPDQATEKFSILDPAMLGRMLERAWRWRAAQKHLMRAVASDSLRNAFACVASTLDLKLGDAIAAQCYSIEAEIARGADLGRLMAAFVKPSKHERPAMSTTSVLAMAAGLAGGASSRQPMISKARISNLPVVVTLLESRLDDSSSDAVLKLAAQRKLPMVIVALHGAFSTPLPDNFAGYEIHRFPRIPVDRADPIAIYRVAHEGIERARIGYGPTLVDCQEWSFSEAENPFKSVERHALSLGVQIRHERFDQRLAAELNGLASEPDVLLFAPE